MSFVQQLRLFSIFNAMLVGFWLPLRMIGFALPVNVDLGFDLLISVASAINIYIHFQKHEQKISDWRNWIAASVILDFVCMLPFMFLEDSLLNGSSVGLVFVNLIAVRHIWKIKDFLDEFDNLKPITYRLVPLGLTMPLLVHLVACGWIALGSGTAGPDADKTFEYVKAFYWAMATLTTVGYGDIAAKTAVQMFYAAGTQLVGVGVFGFVLSNVASLLSRLDAAREHHMDNLDQIETFMDSYKIPTDTRSKVRSYYHYMWKEHRGYMDKSLLQSLPSKLQSELHFSINHAIIERVSFLKDATPEMLEDIMLALDHRVYVPGEKIFRCGDEGDALYMIHAGQIDILTADNKHIASLSEGAVFGEIALISDSPRTATARAASYCDLYALPKKDFNRIIDYYPDFKSHLEEVMRARQAATRAA
jgi:voltage-gated potassium channel